MEPITGKIRNNIRHAQAWSTTMTLNEELQLFIFVQTWQNALRGDSVEYAVSSGSVSL